MVLVPQKAASAAGSEAGMDCGTALAKQARLNPHGEALLGSTSRRPPRGESERKSGSQFGFARKPLNNPDSRKKEIWISLPPALDFLPNDLDLPSRGFGNPATNFVSLAFHLKQPHCLSRSSSAARPARRPFPRREAPAVLRCVNAVVGRARREASFRPCRPAVSLVLPVTQ